MIRRFASLRNVLPKADAERESFSIFSTLAGKKDQTEVEKIADEIMTLSLKELSQLERALNDPDILSKSENKYPVQSSLPLPLNRSPFPHPKHIFAGIDADSRPGMHSP
jgi:hypothetical protein